jgi:hypothetical protein
MPATIIGNSEWTARGLVLTAQNAQEQVNGLVNVQVTYVGPASRHDQISRNFYLDAPPPIFPTVVSPSELVTNRLYMVSRSVSRANGLTTVQADYVGGLQRSGFNGYFLKTEKEPSQSGIAYFLGPVPTGPFPPGFTGSTIFQTALGDFALREVGFFNFDLISQVYEFVEIGNTTAVKLPPVTRNSLMQIYDGDSQFALPAEKAYSAPIVGINGTNYYAEGYADIKFQRKVVDSPQFVTPTVKIIERKFSL